MKHFANFGHQGTRGPHTANPDMKLWVTAFWLKGERLCVTRCRNINFDRKKHVWGHQDLYIYEMLVWSLARRKFVYVVANALKCIAALEVVC